MLVHWSIEGLGCLLGVVAVLAVSVRGNGLVACILRQDRSSKRMHLFHMWGCRSHITKLALVALMLYLLCLFHQVILLFTRYQLLHILSVFVITNIWTIWMLTQLRIILDHSGLCLLMIHCAHDMMLTRIASKVPSGMMRSLVIHFISKPPCICIMKWVINTNNTCSWSW